MKVRKTSLIGKVLDRVNQDNKVDKVTNPKINQSDNKSKGIYNLLLKFRFKTDNSELSERTKQLQQNL